MTSVADLIVNIMQIKNLSWDRSTGVMDWRTEEINQSSVDSFPREKGLAKSKSYLNLPGLEDLEIYSEGIKESRGFTSAFENLKLDSGIEQQIDTSPYPKTKDAETSPFEYNLEAKSPLCGFRTHEKSSLRLVIQAPEILNHQGTMYSAEDLAPYWKKDSRMWLWKSVRFARRKNKAKCSVIETLSNNRHDGFK